MSQPLKGWRTTTYYVVVRYRRPLKGAALYGSKKPLTINSLSVTPSMAFFRQLFSKCDALHTKYRTVTDQTGHRFGVREYQAHSRGDDVYKPVAPANNARVKLVHVCERGARGALPRASDRTIPVIPPRFDGPRRVSTAIHARPDRDRCGYVSRGRLSRPRYVSRVPLCGTVRVGWRVRGGADCGSAARVFQAWAWRDRDTLGRCC